MLTVGIGSEPHACTRGMLEYSNVSEGKLVEKRGAFARMSASALARRD